MKKRTLLLASVLGVGFSFAFESANNNTQSSVSKEVQDFLNDESAYESQIVPSKTYTVDILGRKKNSKQLTLVGKAKTSKKHKIRVNVTNLDIPYYKVKTTTSKMEIQSQTGKVRLWLNGQELSQKEYEKETSKLNRERPPFSPGYTDSLSAEEIINLLKGNKPVYISKFKEPVNQMAHTDILTKSQISTHAFTNSAKGNGIGIYFQETGCPHPYFITTNYIQGNNCDHGVQMHPTGVLQVLSNTAPEATLYGYDQGDWPFSYEHPTGYPDIQIASHSWGVQEGAANEYTDVDRKMDNYVYFNRITSFVAAGNVSPDFPYIRYVSSPGKALNAITVGAVDPVYDTYTSYSQWDNSEIGNEKPEVANYTDFEFNNDYTFSYPCENNTCWYTGYFNGTSAATPYTAAIAADLMSHYPYYLKGHPEMMKAVFLSAEKIPISNASSHDSYNTTNAAKGVSVYSSLAWNRTIHRTWEGENDEVFDANENITFTETGITNNRYRIAISWLSSGEYVLYNKRIPQDIDLYVYQNDSIIAQSNAYDNPFEVVDFTPPTTDNLQIVIHRYRNSSDTTAHNLPPEKVILGYSLWADR